MVYEEVLKLDDFLAHAWLQDIDDRTKTIEGNLIPYMFKVDFFIKDKTKGKSNTWRTTFHIRVPDDDSLELISVHTFGEGEFPSWFFEKLKENVPLVKADFKELERYNETRPHFGVKRFQSEFVAKFQTQLVDRATLMAIQYLATNANVFLSNKQLKELTKQIKDTSRRKVTPALLKQVAKIYVIAISSYPKGNPILEIKDAFNVSHRRAQEYAQIARREGFLDSPESLKNKIERKGK